MEKDIIQIPVSMISLNKVLKWHWSKRLRTRKEYQFMIRGQINKIKCRKATKDDMCKLVITSSVKRKYDYDNLVGGCKMLLDALKREGFIYDDSPDYVNVEYHQIGTKKEFCIIKRLL